MVFTSWMDERYACKQQSPLALMAMGLSSVTFVVNKGLFSYEKNKIKNPCVSSFFESTSLCRHRKYLPGGGGGAQRARRNYHKYTKYDI